MEPISRGIAGLFAPASNTFGVLLFIFHALLIATASALPQVQRPSPSSTACARVGRMTAARLAANPSALPTVPASLAHACLQSVPNKPQPAAKLVASLKAFVGWQSSLPWLKNPPKSYMLPPVDIQGRLDNISATALNGGYASEYDFQMAIFTTIIAAHDGHFSYFPDIFKAFVFRNNLAADIVSVSKDGKEVPKLYHRSAFGPNAKKQPVAITRINGKDAEAFVNEMNLMYSSFQDPDSQWNSQFPSYANPESILAIASALAYMGDNVTLGYENGEEKTEASFAILLRRDFKGINTGEDFYNKFCDPDATSFIAATTKASADLGLERDAVTSPNFPAPIVRDSGANETFGYFLDGGDAYNDVAVLSVSSFSGTGKGAIEYLTNFQAVVAAFLDRSRRAGKKRLVIDLSANGGGLVVAGFELFAQLFPDVDMFGAENLRLTDSLNDIARVFGGLPEGFRPGTFDETRALQALSRNSIVGNLLPGAVFTPGGEPFASANDVIAPPVELQGDRFTAYLHTPLDMPAAEFNLTGTGNRANPPPAVFRPEDVVLLTDGTCGSTCTIFSYLMILQAGVKTVTVGGRPREGPMQAIAGVEGAQIFLFDDISKAASAALELAPAAGVQLDASENGELGTLAAGYAIRRAADPTNAGGSLNGKNTFGKTDAATPLQFLYEPANCRFFYTPSMLTEPANAWRRAVDATWSDPARFCVRGSRTPLDDNVGKTLDPLFGKVRDASTGSTTDGADQRGDSSDNPNVVSVGGDNPGGEEDASSAAALFKKRDQGLRAVFIAVLTTTVWLWIG